MKKNKKFLLLLAVAMTAIVTVAVALTWGRDGSRTAPRPTRPAILSPAEAEHLFRRILLKRQRNYVRLLGVGICGTPGPWIGEDQMGDGPKARLLAKAYPDLAKRLILEVFEDPEAPAIDRSFAITMLVSMPDWTTDRLEELLRAQVETSDDDSFALWALGQRDRKMRHRDLYQRQCREGNYAAFEILSWSPHSTSVALFGKLKRQSADRSAPLGTIPDQARKALAKLEILAAPDWKKTVDEWIRKPTLDEFGYESHDNFSWAVEVARRNALPTLLDALAGRGRLPRDKDRYHDINDIALSMFAEMGGELTPEETARFRPGGFVGDPEERLLEIAAAERIR